MAAHEQYKLDWYAKTEASKVTSCKQLATKLTTAPEVKHITRNARVHRAKALKNSQQTEHSARSQNITQIILSILHVTLKGILSEDTTLNAA